ncbi:hypothetical protein [uncultured Planktomarina sp.]
MEEHGSATKALEALP